VGDSLRWPRDTLYPLKLALTSPTSGGRSVGIVRACGLKPRSFLNTQWGCNGPSTIIYLWSKPEVINSYICWPVPEINHANGQSDPPPFKHSTYGPSSFSCPLTWATVHQTTSDGSYEWRLRTYACPGFSCPSFSSVWSWNLSKLPPTYLLSMMPVFGHLEGNSGLDHTLFLGFRRYNLCYSCQIFC
jgi:hypothetical protein